MESPLNPISQIQQASIKVLWSEYGLQSDGSFISNGSNLSLAFLNTQYNFHFTNHFNMVLGVGPDVLEVLIRDFEAKSFERRHNEPNEASPGLDLANNLNVSMDAPLSFGLVNYLETSTPLVQDSPMGLATKLALTIPVNILDVSVPSSTQAPPNEDFGEQISRPYSEPSPPHPPSLTTPPRQIADKHPAKRPRTEQCAIIVLCDRLGTNGRCPGDKGQGQCSVHNKKRWGQRLRFKKHFADEHMRSYKVSSVSYQCDCNEVFSKTEDGREAFANHVWARLRAEK
ncbi:hypothetical protein E8E13_002657 [Curvularia kusanoi]|uniref:Uncharacterized protein n=1 Tax=Curvularia kusanoi TaxID=90978 RepID=A0A9P4T4X1_CURKU|nr:hypothetical protein E8E13_002657 [Curvularia kusanoi]